MKMTAKFLIVLCVAFHGVGFGEVVGYLPEFTDADLEQAIAEKKLIFQICCQKGADVKYGTTSSGCETGWTKLDSVSACAVDVCCNVSSSSSVTEPNVTRRGSCASARILPNSMCKAISGCCSFDSWCSDSQRVERKVLSANGQTKQVKYLNSANQKSCTYPYNFQANECNEDGICVPNPACEPITCPQSSPTPTPTPTGTPSPTPSPTNTAAPSY